VPDTKIKWCSNYGDNKEPSNPNYKDAPTVCVEGGLYSGTHGEMHHATQEETEAKTKGGTPNSMEAIIDASTDAYVETFSESKCDKKCIKAQLTKFYKKFKTCMDKAAHTDKKGNVIKPKTNDSGQGGL